jgi:integrase
MVANSNKKPPKKPYKEYPLFAHQSGQWAKTIKGKQHYFGVWDDDKGALAEYLRVKDYLHAGLNPPEPEASLGGISVQKLANLFLDQKEIAVEQGDITPQHFQDYKNTFKELLETWKKGKLVKDLTPRDFTTVRNKWKAKYSGTSLDRKVIGTRSLFKWGWESAYLENAVRFGPDFKGSSARDKRKAKYEQGRRDIEAKDLRKILKASKEGLKNSKNTKLNPNPKLHAMILLGINSGFGNTDVAELHKDYIDLKKGLIDYPRPKTYVERKCKLWPETVEALKVVINNPAPIASPEYERLVFRTRLGGPWVKRKKSSKSGDYYNDDSVAKEFRKIVKCLKLTRENISFYDLRRTFETVAGGCRDQVAVDYAMGHCDESMASIYRQGIEPERLEDVATHVHEWLFV